MVHVVGIATTDTDTEHVVFADIRITVNKQTRQLIKQQKQRNRGT